MGDLLSLLALGSTPRLFDLKGLELFQAASKVKMAGLNYSGLVAALCFVQMAYAKLVRFNVTLTWDDWEDGPGAPRKMIFANNQLPAPLLQLNQGDDVEFRVSNSMNKSTTVHFHGKAVETCIAVTKVPLTKCYFRNRAIEHPVV